MSTPQTPTKQPSAYPLRLPPELHARVKQLAEREHRTINNLLIHIVSEYLDPGPPPKEPR